MRECQRVLPLTGIFLLRLKKYSNSISIQVMASAYEKARLANIARNNEVLEQLGLKDARLPRRKKAQRAKRPPRKAGRKRKPQGSPVRRSKRNSGKPPVDYTGMSVIGQEENEDSDFDDSLDEGASNSESDEEWSDSTLPPPKSL